MELAGPGRHECTALIFLEQIYADIILTMRLSFLCAVDVAQLVDSDIHVCHALWSLMPHKSGVGLCL